MKIVLAGGNEKKKQKKTQITEFCIEIGEPR